LRRLLSLGVVLVAAAFALGGCAGEATESGNADLTNGKQLFGQKCGQCHTMQAGGPQAQGRIGPNLDHAFGFSRAQDFDQTTFFEVTLGQMSIPVPPMPDYDEEGTKDFLPEEDRIAIAAFVAECSALNQQELAKRNPVCTAGAGGGQGATSGQAIFSQSCASCHTLAAADATGTIGPNLDQSQIALDAAITQIIEGGGGMPPFGDTLNDQQIRAVARYIVENRGG
jgi:mono/diheme cytochrome c family protein